MKWSNLLSSLIIGISIVSAAFILKGPITASLNKIKADEEPIIQLHTVPHTELMSIKQLSDYLQISEKSIESIMGQDDFNKSKMSDYDTYQFIPYLILDDQYKFLKSEIDKWLKYKNEMNF
ncbi:Clp protease ClpB [Fictibacillus barbaricus]|uniref:Clp protease ClpB n=1 Tax=Fictibacillus barbaricus TaxID=182136 RepID=A0ABS2ZH22_9BACL|nr:Clp protease ClpB [Fictibacillus barbaricus]MBN3546726.1 Clp protease ClpB [Fictibacillus barbaricus]GGB43385.1 hypothetical protein GCM10007199_05860 [Fictibacillus barbaricus]